MVWGKGIAYGQLFRERLRANRMQISTSERRAAAHLLPPGRTARPRGVPLRRLARRRPGSRGGRCCRSDRRTGPARRTPRRPRSRRTRGYLERPRAPVTRTRSRSSSPASAYWIADWAAFAGARARSPTRCASTASGARCAGTRRERGVRLLGDVPIYVAQGGADMRRPARALPARRGRGRAARRAQRGRPALGQPALRLARAPRERLPLVDRALPPHVRARRRRADRPLPRLRLLLGGAGAAQDGEERALAPRPGRGPLPTRPSASSGRCRSSPRTSA